MWLNWGGRRLIMRFTNRRNIIRCALSFLFLLGLTSLFAHDNSKDWPLFRGTALQTGVAQSTLPDKLEQLWSFPTGDSIESAPAVGGGVVYLASTDEHLYAV